MSGPEQIPVGGTAAAPFEELREVFARAVSAQGEGGAALAVVRDGELVVDLWGGTYAADTVQPVFSVSKAVTAIVAAHAADAGLLDLDEPLASDWPEFRRASTAAITPRMVLAHRSGIASLDRRLGYDELMAGAAEDAVAQQEPYWEPNTRHGYHAFTFAPLLEGVFRRRVGTTVGEYLAEHVAGPLGVDVWLGLPDAAFPRVAKVRYLSPAISETRAAFVAASGIPAGTTAALSREMDIYNDPGFLRAGFPSSSGVAGARDLARLLAATLDGPLLSDAARRSFEEVLSRGTDAVLGVETAFSSGMQLPFAQLPLYGGRSYGHEAAGGSFVFADPDSGLAVAWTTDVFPRMAGASPAGLALVDTIRHCMRGLAPRTEPRSQR
ncbi:beta-lactamase family protein [Protaetiibacter sp. SSC-01]|uniref:serine hydrolase domain-containing protein n=1 Tax=Protaetiibacter sp. SSC-01 TaxID=2759943 RepID=UPI001656B1B1|nr:serine hydrolase domain-containing protein [Protaetiibacter sp. SSC-01]QNO36893.1 beta-lactamase family protein [Protaetiibacter sp. SSC-01]